MSISIEILIGVFGVFVAVTTFFIGRTSSAKTEGASLEGMRKDIEYIVKDIRACSKIQKVVLFQQNDATSKINKGFEGIE